jgi:hypothetical protein
MLDVIRAVNISPFLDVTLWSLKKIYRPFGGACFGVRKNLQTFRGCMPPLSSDLILETDRSLRKVRVFSQDSMATPQGTILENI